MSRTIRTHNGTRSMRVDYTVPDVCGMSLDACLTVLRASDPNDVYTQEEHIITWGEPWTLLDARLQVVIEMQDPDRKNAIEWHEIQRVDRVRRRIQAWMRGGL